MNRHIRLFVLLSAVSSFLLLTGCSGASVGVYTSYGYPYYGYGHGHHHTDIDIDVDIDRPNKPERPDRPPARPERPSPPGNIGRPPSNRGAARPARGGGGRKR